MGRHLHPDSNSRWEVPSDSKLESWLGRVPGGASTPQVRLQFAARRRPVFHTRLHADNNQLTCKFAALVIVINALVLTRKSWNVLDPQGLARPSRGKKSQDLLSVLSSGLQCLLTPPLWPGCSSAVWHAASFSVIVRSERGLVRPLKPEHDYFTSFPNKCREYSQYF